MENCTARPFIVVGIGAAACGGAPKVDWDLKIMGEGFAAKTYTYQDLSDMSFVELNDVLMEKSTGEDEITSWSGIALDELLAQAGVAGDYASITALAADGYAVEITRDELQGSIIALKDRGKWIASVTPDKGPIRLVCPQAPGNRWVFQLTEIQVNR
jgi:DMSO/TMAO reductase YedYZ molybdopterin-dependent catalytic subunit